MSRRQGQHMNTAKPQAEKNREAEGPGEVIHE